MHAVFDHVGPILQHNRRGKITGQTQKEARSYDINTALKVCVLNVQSQLVRAFVQLSALVDSVVC